MKANRHSIIALILILCSALLVLGGTAIMVAEKKVLYTIELDEANKNVQIKKIDEKLQIIVSGFGDVMKIEANGGGVSACRTIIKHKSEKANVEIALPIPNPRVRCRMLPGSVCIQSTEYGISYNDEEIKKGLGEDSVLRATVEEIFGEIEED